jgi:hypothetical protein
LKALIIFLVLHSGAIFAIDDSSFANKDRYVLLSLNSIKKNTSFNVTASCFPPKGKKLNPHSLVRIWEKINGKWILADKISPDEDFGLNTNYKMAKKVSTSKQNSEIALEIDFIHCNKNGGGQCSMEKYLGKIVRTEKAKDDQLIFDLRI